MKKIIWSNSRKRIKDLKKYDPNPRRGTDKDQSDLDRSLSKFGLASPIIINKDNTIIGGHFRIKVLKEQGETEADVRVPDRLLTDAEVRELNLRLNKNLGRWDLDGLANYTEDELFEVGFESRGGERYSLKEYI